MKTKLAAKKIDNKIYICIPEIIKYELKEVASKGDCMIYFPVTKGVAPIVNPLRFIDRPYHIIKRQQINSLTKRYATIEIEVAGKHELKQLVIQ